LLNFEKFLKHSENADKTITRKPPVLVDL
jgi:hypothetical protein